MLIFSIQFGSPRFKNSKQPTEKNALVYWFPALLYQKTLALVFSRSERKVPGRVKLSKFVAPRARVQTRRTLALTASTLPLFPSTGTNS